MFNFSESLRIQLPIHSSKPVLTSLKGLEMRTLGVSTCKCLSLAFAVIAVSGCGGSSRETYPVEGRVVWKDGTAATELAEGTVELQASDEVTKRVSPRGEVQSDGSFVLKTYQSGDGAPPGRYRAIIMPKLVIDDEVRAALPILHSKFQSFTTTPLTVEVKTEPNEVDLTVERGS